MNPHLKDKTKPQPGQDEPTEALRLPESLPMPTASHSLTPAKPAEMTSAEWAGMISQGFGVGGLRFGRESETERSAETPAPPASAPKSPASTGAAEPVSKKPQDECPPAKKAAEDDKPASPPPSPTPQPQMKHEVTPEPPPPSPLPSAPEPMTIEVKVVPSEPAPSPSSSSTLRPLALFTGHKVPLISLASDAAGRPAMVVALHPRLVEAGTEWTRTLPHKRRLVGVLAGALLAGVMLLLVWGLYPVDRRFSVPLEIATVRTPPETVLREHRLTLVGEEFATALRRGKTSDRSQEQAAALSAWQALRDGSPLAGTPVLLAERLRPTSAVCVEWRGHNPTAQTDVEALLRAYRQWQSGLAEGGLSARLDVVDRQNQRQQLQLEIEKVQARLNQFTQSLAEADRAVKEVAEQRTVLEKAKDTLAGEYTAARATLDKLLGGKGPIDFSPSAAELAAARKDDPAFARVEVQLQAARREHRRLLREAMESAAQSQKLLVDNLKELSTALATANTSDLSPDLALVVQKVSEENLGWQLVAYRLAAAWQTLSGQMLPGTTSETSLPDVAAVQNGVNQAADQYQFQSDQHIQALADALHTLAAGGTNMAARMSLSAGLVSKFDRSRMVSDQLRDQLSLCLPQGAGLRLNVALQSTVSREQAAWRELANLDKALIGNMTAKAQSDFERDREGQLRKIKATADRAFSRLEKVQGELAKLQDEQAALQTKQSGLQGDKQAQENLKSGLVSRLSTLEELINRLSQEASLSADQVDVAALWEQTDAGAETRRVIWMFVLGGLGFLLGLGLVGAWNRLAGQLSRTM